MLSIIRSGDDKLTPIGTIYVPRSPVGSIRSILGAPDLSPSGNSPGGLIFPRSSNWRARRLYAPYDWLPSIPVTRTPRRMVVSR